MKTIFDGTKFTLTENDDGNWKVETNGAVTIFSDKGGKTLALGATTTADGRFGICLMTIDAGTRIFAQTQTSTFKGEWPPEQIVRRLSERMAELVNQHPFVKGTKLIPDPIEAKPKITSQTNSSNEPVVENAA